MNSFSNAMPAIGRRLVFLATVVALLLRAPASTAQIPRIEEPVTTAFGTYVPPQVEVAPDAAWYVVEPGMGNVINMVLGKGIHTVHDIKKSPGNYPHLTTAIEENDTVLLHKIRVANLRKLYPYIPAKLNAILMRFSADATNFYTDIDNQVNDLKAIFS